MVQFDGFQDQDFDVFKIEGLDERMTAIKEKIRPKLKLLGEHFAPTLSTLTGDEMFAHVAKHARRKKNPPDDTWVAFANNKRGYKKLPHFQIGLWETHLFVWFAVIYESPIKESFAKKLDENLNEIKSEIPSSFVWSVDHTKPEAIKHEELSQEDFSKMIHRLKTVKKAEILSGIHIDRHDPMLQNKNQLIDTIDKTFKTLMPLYNLAQNIDL